MDFQSFLAAIPTVGFPICACIAISIFLYKTIDNYRADIKELQASQKEETKALVDAVNNNTLVIQQLVDKMKKED